MKKYFLFGFLVLTAVLVSAGCSKKELSKEEAKDMLSRKPAGKLMRTIHKNLVIKPIDPATEVAVETEKTLLEKMQKAGFVSIKEKSVKAARTRTDSLEVTATDKLTPFLISQDAETMMLRLADIAVDQVTEITRKGDEADVAFTSKLVPNELGEEVFAPLANPSPGPNHAIFRWADGKWQ